MQAHMSSIQENGSALLSHLGLSLDVAAFWSVLQDQRTVHTTLLASSKHAAYASRSKCNCKKTSVALISWVPHATYAFEYKNLEISTILTHMHDAPGDIELSSEVLNMALCGVHRSQSRSVSPAVLL
jgi:hypothetical protein